jgi:hypothetical protein
MRKLHDANRNSSGKTESAFFNSISLHNLREAKIKRCVVVCFFGFVSTIAVPCAGAACHVVTLAGGGTKTGSDWANACAAFSGTCSPSKLLRGDTYYIAAGSGFPAVTLNTPPSGIEPITIKRATVSEHCTNTGWQNGDDGQVLWTAPVIFGSSYWVFEGVTGNASAGNVPTAVPYGFLFSSDQDSVNFMQIDRSASPIPHDITVNHVEVNGVNCCDIPDTTGGMSALYFNGVNGPTGGGADCTSLATSNISLSYVYFHDLKRDPITMFAVSGFLLDHGYLARNRSTAAMHAQGIQFTGSNNVTVRYSSFEDIAGTAEITFIGYCPSSNVSVYGNKFYYTGKWPQAPGSTGVSYMFEAIPPAGSVTNLAFYNNTIYNFTLGQGGSLNAGFYPDSGAQNYRVYDNLWFNNSAQASAVSLGGSTHDFNSIMNTPLAWNWTKSANENQTNNGSVSPFVNAAGGNFQLVVSTAPGTTLSSPYNFDPSGVARGATGNWDRGAYQCCATAPPTNLNGIAH